MAKRTPRNTSRWYPMSSAPMDGTVIMVIETANGETFQTLPAAYMNFRGGNPHFGESPIGTIGWYAVFPSRRSGEGGDCELPVRWQPLSSTPVCWQPMPEQEPMEKLRRRLAQVMRNKQKNKEAA